MDGPPTKPSAPRNPERTGLGSAAGSPPAESAQDDLERLRSLLFRPEAQRLDSIQERIEDPETRCDEVAEALPEAVRRAAASGPSLAASLSPLVEQGLAQSIRRDPSAIIEVIFPVLGPAIRRAVASALRGAVESLNRVIEHSFTWRGLRWRMEAWRTGQPVAEVALSRSVVYRVEQVFLIHRETGLPLMVVGADEERRDPDLVSSMLTAIQDFVHDSFSVSGDQDLDQLEVGDFQVWIERGPRAAVAAVIRGSARRRLRTQLSETIGDIHAQLREPLERFDGDATPFEPARPMLEACLEQEFIRPRKRKGLQPSAIVAIALVLLVAAGYFWWRWRDQQRWDSYLAALDAEPGLVAFDEGERGGLRRALVLRDPLAVDPATLLAGANVDPSDVALRVESVVSTDPAIVVRRARILLGAPDTVELAIENGALVATGSAPADWIREAEARAAFVPGVDVVNLEALGDAARLELEALAGRLAELRVRFARGSAQLEDSQQGAVDAMTAGLLECLRLTESLGIELRAHLLGGADASGAEQTNARLRMSRGEAVRRRLVAGGVPAEALVVQPAGRDLGNSAEERRSVAVEIELP